MIRTKPASNITNLYANLYLIWSAVLWEGVTRALSGICCGIVPWGGAGIWWCAVQVSAGMNPSPACAQVSSGTPTIHTNAHLVYSTIPKIFSHTPCHVHESHVIMSSLHISSQDTPKALLLYSSDLCLVLSLPQHTHFKCQKGLMITAKQRWLRVNMTTPPTLMWN